MIIWLRANTDDRNQFSSQSGHVRPEKEQET